MHPNLSATLAASSALMLSMFQRTPRPVRSSPRKIKLEQPIKSRDVYKAVVHYKHADLRQDLLNKMTNWQLNQAGRACKGDFQQLTDDQLKHFADMRRTPSQ